MYTIDSYILGAFKKAKNPILAEKDYLECIILERLFSDSFFNDNFIFAGGGTITKVYKIGNRIGQDVDLACTTFDTLPTEPTRHKYNKFKHNFRKFVFQNLKPCVADALQDLGCFKISTPQQLEPTLHISYSSAIKPHMENFINVEFIPRQYEPISIELRNIVPYSLDTSMSTLIPTVHYAQTFWDKVYALHTIHQIGTMRPGLAHHYYDVVNLAPHTQLDKTKNMFKSIEQYQQTYTWRQLQTLDSLTKINLIPNNKDLHTLEQEYKNMTNRFICHTDYSWADIIEKLHLLNKILQNINYGDTR